MGRFLDYVKNIQEDTFEENCFKILDMFKSSNEVLISSGGYYTKDGITSSFPKCQEIAAKFIAEGFRVETKKYIISLFPITHEFNYYIISLPKE